MIEARRVEPEDLPADKDTNGLDTNGDGTRSRAPPPTSILREFIGGSGFDH